MAKEPEVNDKIKCPHCDKELDRLTVRRFTTEAGERIYVLVAGVMNSKALRELSRLLHGLAK